MDKTTWKEVTETRKLRHPNLKPNLEKGKHIKNLQRQDLKAPE